MEREESYEQQQQQRQQKRRLSPRPRTVPDLIDVAQLNSKGIAPQPHEVDAWLVDVMGLTRFQVGTSFQGRPLWAYQTKCNKDVDQNCTEEPAALFLSLEHGNEPLGLLSLLWTAQLIQTTPLDQLHPNIPTDIVKLQDTTLLRRRKEAQNRPTILASSSSWSASNHTIGGSSMVTPHVIFFPFVNVDAYLANLEHGHGCRRSNMRETCSAVTNGGKVPTTTTTIIHNHPTNHAAATNVHTCPRASQGGVDLNRNHPADWTGQYADRDTNDDHLGSPCGITYKGTEPWSEPEARAIRDVIQSHQVVAALSFHTRGDATADALLIHPFTSSRPLSFMSLAQLNRYRQWSRFMNTHDSTTRQEQSKIHGPNQHENYYHPYLTGTASETISYTASGSTIDWMHDQGVTSFVVESKTPCQEDGRWCNGQDFGESEERQKTTLDIIMELTRQDGMTGVKLVQLVAADLAAKVIPAAATSLMEREGGSIMMSNKVLILAMLMLVGIVFGRRCRLAHIRWLARRAWTHVQPSASSPGRRRRQ